MTIARRLVELLRSRSGFALVCLPASILLGATVAGYAGRLFWAADLFSHFRVQYSVSLVVVAVLALVGRHRRLAVVLGAVALVNGAEVVPCYLPEPVNAARPAGPAYRALLLNVHTRNDAYGRVYELVSRHQPDFIVLEEVSDAWMVGLAGLEAEYPHRLARPRSDNFGIALYSKRPWRRAEIVEIGPAGVPSVVAEIELEGGLLSIVGTHPLPPVGRRRSHARDEQLAALPGTVRVLPGAVLLLGDLNTTPWSHTFRDLRAESGLRDSARGRGIQPTWPASNPLLAIPLDHVLHSEDIVILDRQIGSPVGSDHLPVIVEFALGRR